MNTLTPNGQASANDTQLYLLYPSGIKTPVKFDIFKYGGGIVLALVNHDKNVHIPLMGNVSAMRLELQGALYRIELATETNDQGYLAVGKDGSQ